MIDINQPCRVEILNWKNKWELLGVCQNIKMAQLLAKDYDDYFVRIVEVSPERNEIWRNFSSVTVDTTN